MQNNGNTSSNAASKSPEKAAKFFRYHTVRDIDCKPLTEQSRFLKLMRMTFTQEKEQVAPTNPASAKPASPSKVVTKRVWDLVDCHPAVSVLVYHKEKRAFILVCQYRPPVHFHQQKWANLLDKPWSEHKADWAKQQEQKKKEKKAGEVEWDEELPPPGWTYELVAGLLDKPGESLEQIACEEVQEECGYKVDPKNLIRVCTYVNQTGQAGSRSWLFYAEVDESMHVGRGGGVGDEDIRVVFLPVSKARDFVLDPNPTKATGLAFGFYWFLDYFRGTDKVAF